MINTIMSSEDAEIKSAIAMANFQRPKENSSSIPPHHKVVAAYCCESTGTTVRSSCSKLRPHTVSKGAKSFKTLELPIISEVVPIMPYKDKPNLLQLDKKLSNTSVHKKRRGLIRKVNYRICGV